jgi:hydrophobe/amphiphile efflux-1 (HAE1) family protein
MSDVNELPPDEQPTTSTPAPKRHGGLPSFSIRRPIGTTMMTLVLLVLGFFFLGGLPLDLLPSIVYPNLRANVTNRGVEPQVLEETVAKPLEAALSTTENLVRMETDIGEGRVGVNLNFSYGTDIDFALQDASKNMERVRAAIPDEADPPTIFKFDPSQSPIYEVAFSSGDRDLVSLRDWVDQRLRPQLLTIEGVASIDISGGLVREILVTLDQERLRSYGLTVSQVIDAIRQGNQDVAAGRVSSSTREIVGKTTGKFRTVDDVRSVLLAVPGRGRVPLSEVATVADTHREQRLWARLDGVPAVRLNVRKQPNANTVGVAEQVHEKLATLQSSSFIPRDIKYSTINNQSTFIRNSIGSVRDAALLGAGLSMLVVLLFLGSLRKTFVIGLAIPIAILATFMLMGLGNLTLNMMSLGGLALGVGMLVDNSIVMLENIFRHREIGHLDAEEAAHTGAAEVHSAVVASTATHLAAVVPFLMISGLAALIFRELIITISFSILASLLVALTIVPMLSAQFAKVRFSSGLHHSGPLVAFDRGVQKLRNGYVRAGPSMVRWRWVVFGAAVLALVVVSQLTKNLGSQFLPPIDDGNVTVNMTMSPGVSAEETNRLSLELEEMVRQMPGVQTMFATAGGQGFGGSTAEQSGRGNITIVLQPMEERGMTAGEWVQRMQQRIDARGFPGSRIFVRPPSIRGLRTNTAGAPVALTITGDDLAELRLIGEDLLLRLRGIPGLENLTPSADEATPQLAIELDRERAAYLGLNVATVGQTLRTALDGTIATRFTSGNQEFDLRVRLPREKFTSPEDVGSVALFPGIIAGGAPIYLRDVARVYTTAGPTQINRENQSRIFRLTGDVITDVASVGTVNDSIRARMAGYTMPDGYGLIIGGEEEAIRDNNRQLAIVVFLAIFLVFVVLAVQYESVVNPFVILFAIPLSLIGVGFSLWATQTPLSAPVLLGVILLAGIVVNNSILLVEYAEQARARGVGREAAVIEAGSIRLRPILMTTLTTCFGMLPLALGIGDGAELMQPLAIAVVGGLSVSTVLTLFVVPGAYVICTSAAERLASFLTGGKQEPAQQSVRPKRPEREQVPAEVGAD